MSEYMSEYITHFKCTKTSKIIIPIQIFRKTFKVIEYNIIYLIQTCKNRMRGVKNHNFCMLLLLTHQPFFICLDMYLLLLLRENLQALFYIHETP